MYTNRQTDGLTELFLKSLSRLKKIPRMRHLPIWEGGGKEIPFNLHNQKLDINMREGVVFHVLSFTRVRGRANIGPEKG